MKVGQGCNSSTDKFGFLCSALFVFNFNGPPLDPNINEYLNEKYLWQNFFLFSSLFQTIQQASHQIFIAKIEIKKNFPFFFLKKQIKKHFQARNYF